MLTSRMSLPTDRPRSLREPLLCMRRGEESGLGGRGRRAEPTPQLRTRAALETVLEHLHPEESGTEETVPKRTCGTRYRAAVPQSPAGKMWQKLGHSQNLPLL